MPQELSKSEVAEDLLNVSDRVDGHMTVSEYEDLGNYTYKAISNKFGTFNNAKRELGIRSGLKRRRRTTDEELLEKIQTLDNTLGGDVSAQDFDTETKHSKTTIQRRFGSWSKAKELAGIVKNNNYPTTYEGKYKRLNQIKENVGCALCGYSNCSAALEFHHTDPDTKAETVGKLVGGCAWEKVLKELRKCVIVCANCHREIEYQNKQLPEHHYDR